MRSDQRHGPLITIAAASAVCLVFGTVHAFSVFLAPLEQTFGASRSAVSLTYSIALVALTFAVLFGPRLYTVMTTRSIILLATTLGAAGTVISAFAPALWLIWIGYGLVFGAANGLGYGFCLQLSAAAAPGREGLAMGTVTASYALGATLAPAGFLHAMESGGFQTAMITLAAILVTFGGAAASMLALPTRLNVSTDSAPHQVVVSKSRINLMRVTYGAAVASGLIDTISSMHTPQDEESKRLPFEEAASGAVALETLLPAAMRLVHGGHMDLPTLWRALSLNPAKRLGLTSGRLSPDAPADLVLFDPDAPFRLNRFELTSKSKNTPFDDARLQGKVRGTWVGGTRVFGDT